jgi:hypothetical protein
MTLRKGYAVINGISTSADGEYKPLDYRFDENSQRSYLGNLTTGDTVRIMAQGVGYVAGTKPAVYTTVETTLDTHTTTSFAGIIEGPYHAIRFDKIGANGVATVIAYL